MNRNLWVENLFRPLVIGTMVGCVALSLGGLARLFFPAWDATYLVVGCVLAARHSGNAAAEYDDGW